MKRKQQRKQQRKQRRRERRERKQSEEMEKKRREVVSALDGSAAERDRMFRQWWEANKGLLERNMRNSMLRGELHPDDIVVVPEEETPADGGGADGA